MAFCPKCGTAAEGSFCPACGTQISAGDPDPSTVPAPLDDHLVNALCYLLCPLTGVLFLVLDDYKANKSIRFHAFQSIFFFVAVYAGFKALQILSFTPFVRLLFSLVTLAYPFGAFVFWLFLVIKAYNKQRYVIPLLGPLAESQA